MALAALLIPAYAGLCMGSGLGTVVDIGGALVLGAVVLALATLVVLLVLTIVKRMPRRFTALVIVTLGCLVLMGKQFGFSPEFSLHLGGLPVLMLATAGAGVSLILRRGPGRAGVIHAAVGSVILFSTATGAVVLLQWLASPGSDPFLDEIRPVAHHVAPLDAPNPALPGPYEVVTLSYGSGTDLRRPEYGSEVDIVTESVDASSFATGPDGFKGWARRKYWGFEADSLPLNARVWAPDGDGPFPLVLIVHGNHKMEDLSDPGYAYLGELLAGRGFITASVDENFLNGSWTGDLGCENDARGWLLLKHLELWREWNEDHDNPFYQTVDLENIALIGHSRGGEAILHAAAFNTLAHYPDNAKIRFDFGFSIRTLIAIAPIDGQYEPAGRPVPVENVNYLVLQGSHDSDLDFFAGARSYRRIRFTNDDYWMKSALYIHRANHGQFNTVWGPYDAGPPLSHLLSRGPLLPGTDQRTIAQVYISAFLETTLRDRTEYVPMFRDYRVATDWLPETVYFNRFEESGFHVVADFDESIDVTRTTLPGGTLRGDGLSIWRQQEMKGRGDWPFHDHAVVLGWNIPNGPNTPSYTITLPDTLPPDWRLDERTHLSFCLADTDQQCDPLFGNCITPDEAGTDDANDVPDGSDVDDGVDLTIELVSGDGRVAALPLSQIAVLQPALRVTFTKWAYWERVRDNAVEPVLQTYEIPLADFARANPDFDPDQLREIRFRFDRTRTRVILLDHVGFAPHGDSLP